MEKRHHIPPHRVYSDIVETRKQLEIGSYLSNVVHSLDIDYKDR